ncbi:winged helix DNA-binding protein [Rhizobium sp. G187]|uniref:winged helix DNA-binding protein n=1 Tax=Rhizobium sp. G187 TaxID=3451352 RepID=UPI003EE644BA
MEETMRLEAFWPYRVMHLAEVLDRAFLSLCGPEDELSWSEWQVLWCLGQSSPGTAKAIALRCGLSKTKISRAVRVLEDKRYLTRKRDRTDRRFELLSLTEAGAARFGRLEGQAQLFQRWLERNVNIAYLSSLDSGLRGFEDLIETGHLDKVSVSAGALSHDLLPGV